MVAVRVIEPKVTPFEASGSQSRALQSVGLPDCHRCKNTRFVEVPSQRAVKRCRCVLRYQNRKALAIIPTEHFGIPKLSRLQPRPDIHPSQCDVIPLVKSQPNSSYLLCGVNESGKSHIAWALYRHAVAGRRRVVASSLNQLLRQYRDWELLSPDTRFFASRERSKERPLVLPEDLVSLLKHTLFLDEFEKANVTEFTCRMLFELLSAARDFGHQVILTSNKGWDDLCERWSQIDEVYGRSIMTRLRGCVLIEMF